MPSFSGIGNWEIKDQDWRDNKHLYALSSDVNIEFNSINNNIDTLSSSKLETSAIQFVSTSAEAITGTQGVIYIVTGTNE